MGVPRSRKIVPLLTGIRDDHPDESDVDDGLMDEFDRCEEAVDLIRALDQDSQLTATAATGREETLRILEVVVVSAGSQGVFSDRWSDDLSIAQ